MASPYDSAPLELGKSTNIRLVEMELGPSFSESDPISCKLHTFPLHVAPPYKALSYVWGDPEATKTILLSGTPFTVRTNLFNFLCQWRRTLRLENEGQVGSEVDQGIPDLDWDLCSEDEELRSYRQYIWIDALSIDQSNDRERGHQVSMMGDIYSSASSVTVWLGESNELVQYVMELAQDYMMEIAGNDLSRIGEYDFHLLSFADQQVRDKFIKGMYEMLSNIYWKRAWIVQEFVLARQVNIWCGVSEMDGKLLLSASISTKSHKKQMGGKYLRSETKGFDILDFKSELARAQRTTSIDDVMGFLGTRMDCTDPRDRVYSLLSLLKQQERRSLGIEPDYTKSTSQLCADMLRGLKRMMKPKDELNWTFDLREALDLDPYDRVVPSTPIFMKKPRPSSRELPKGDQDGQASKANEQAPSHDHQ